MKISDVKINGMNNPVGYGFDSIRVSWKVGESRGSKQKNAKIEISETADFNNILYVKEDENLSQTGEVVELKLEPRKRYYVSVTVMDDAGESACSDTSYFETAKMQETWQAKWITTESEYKSSPLFFKKFDVKKSIDSASLYICGLGLFTAELNGKKIGDEVLTPYYSDYREEEQYITFDIKNLLESQNEIRVSLGNGWYKGKFGLAGQSDNFGNRFLLIAEMHIHYADGSDEIIGTDESWNYMGSDIEDNSIYDGEIINHLLWENKENKIYQAIETECDGILIERYSLPVREMENMPVKEIIQTPAGETVLDFGQNFAGYITFVNNQKKGVKLVFDFGEILQNGNFYNENYRSAKSQFVYISDGREELVRPSFTFFGFRYVRVMGWEGEIRKTDILGKAVYSDMEITGKIETGHAGVNRLFLNAMWGQKSNSIDFPTDCPQRDERLGWCGDAQVFARTAAYNMNTAAFYNKFIHDLRLAQKKANGILPGVIPVFAPETEIASSIWSDIATFLPDALYEYYGDKTALAQYFPMMKDWVDWITEQDKARGQKYLYDFGNQLGDWLALDGRTEQSMEGGTDEYFIGSCYYSMSVKKVANAAKILGYNDLAKEYEELYSKIYEAILREYFTSSGRLAIDTQTGYITALYAGVYKDKKQVIEGLKGRLFKDCYKLKGGFAGAPIMCKVMAENDMVEEAFYFLMQEDYPGWMHCIELGATTIWERWNSVLDNGLLSGTMMNSLNHYSYGAIVEYLYRDVAGFKALEPGFKKALITPLMNGKMKYMKMSYDSIYGKYRVEWKINRDGSVHVEIEVPFNCTAVVGLPFYDGDVEEVDAGIHEYDYQPTEDLRHRYTRKTLFKDMMKDEKAMAIIERVSPMLMHFLSTGNEDYFFESLDTMKRLTFMGFKPEEIDQLTSELTGLVKDMEEEQ